MIDANEVRKIVGDLLSKHLDGIEIVAINVHPGEDADGDAVLTINVVFEDKQKLLVPRKISSMPTRVRRGLLKTGEEGFPIMSFIAKSELGKVSPEAA